MKNSGKTAKEAVEALVNKAVGNTSGKTEKGVAAIVVYLRFILTTQL